MLTSTATNNRAAPASQRGDDLYQTPAECIRALMDVEPLPQRVWEPACGPGAICVELERAGHTVIDSDIRQHRKGQIAVCDFLTVEKPPMEGFEAIITNPPFKTAEQFVHKALYFCPTVYMLLRLGFIEGLRWEERGLSAHLRHVWVFSPRPPRMHMEGWTGPKTDAAGFTVGWFCFQRNYLRTPTVGWVDPRQYREGHNER